MPSSQLMIVDRCTDLRNDMLDLQKRVTKMSKADEPTKMTNFDGKKGDELKRLQKMIVSRIL